MAFIHEHIILPLSDLLQGQSVHRYLRLLDDASHWDKHRMEDFQQGRLRMLFELAARQVPFYRDWFHDHGLVPTEARLEQLPIVSKAIMRQEGIDKFTNGAYPLKQRLTSRSSGSTGEPFTFYETKESYSVNMAVKLHSWFEAGYRVGDRYMKIANSVRKSRFKQMQDRVNNCLYVPFYSMTEASMKQVLDTIEQTRPLFIRSYPAPLYLLAKYRNSHPGYWFSPLHIMTTGSTLTEAHRGEIERAFGCDIIDSYSCEGTPDVYETTAHDGYRVAGYYGIVEVLDNDNRPVGDGIGRVVSTDLWNLAHPFLRYDTQDLVEVRGGRIVRIMGRDCESFVSANGTLITIHNLTKFFANDIAGIQAYRMIYRKDKTVEFQLVTDGGYNKETEQYISDYWKETLGLPITITLVDDIPLKKNNKRQTIICET